MQNRVIPIGKKNLVVGSVRNCSGRLKEDVFRVKDALSDFKDLHWLLIESDSEDDSLLVLDQLCHEVHNFRYISLGNLRENISSRTERIAYCRNIYLDEISGNSSYADVMYVIISDFDGLNSLITREAVMSCWENDDWDICTANQLGPYYDVWALRHDSWCPNDCWKQNNFLEKYDADHEEIRFASVYSRMITIPIDSEWIEVESAFGGFAIYKKEVLQLSKYLGKTKEGDEICEHVPFHQDIRKRGYRIFINPKMINSGVNEHSEATVARKLLSNKLKKIIKEFRKKYLSP